MPQDFGQDLGHATTFVWVPIAEAARLLTVDPGTVRRRYNNANYRFGYEKREHAGRTEYGIPQAELDELSGVGFSSSSVPGGAGHYDPNTTGTSPLVPGTEVTEQTDQHLSLPGADGHRPAAPLSEWRDDLASQVEDQRQRAERAEAENQRLLHVHESSVADLRIDSGRREEFSKARIIDLERELTVRDSNLADLRAQITDLEVQLREAHVRSESNAMKWAERADELSHRIAGLVDQHQQANALIYELQPEAEKVPMLEAVVEERNVTLSERERALEAREYELNRVRDDIETIASRPVAGPVFRLLTRGKLRI